MNLDVITLMVAGSITTALAGVLLLAIWTQLRDARALLWWASSHLIYSVGTFLLSIALPSKNFPLLAVGGTLSDIAPPLLWIGFCVFRGRRLSRWRLALAVTAWLLVDFAAGALGLNPIVSFAGWVVWLSFAGYELWRGRAEYLAARTPLLIILAIHAFVYLGGVYDALEGTFDAGGMATIGSWFGAIFVENMIYSMSAAIFMALLCRERETQHYARAARHDSLTGVANHAALLEGARRLLARCQQETSPLSLIMFDIDHFKNVNDAFGHQAGDTVLNSFANTVRGALRPQDLAGRYGGEEFAVILPNATIETAYVIAERVRHAFAESHRFLNGQPLGVTVSAGVAEAAPGSGLEDTIDAADAALYNAKRLGRNRVEKAGNGRPDGGQRTIIRVA